MADLVYTRKEAAERLKVGLPLLDVWLNRADRPIPHVREGRKVLIPVAQMEEWVAEEAIQYVEQRAVTTEAAQRS